MVTNNEVNSPFGTVLHLLYSFYSAVQRYYQGKAIFVCVIYSFVRDPIPLSVAVWNIIIQVILAIFPQKRIYERDSRCTVHIVVPVNQDFLLCVQSPGQPVNCQVHIFHKERIVQLVQLRP
ncbi:hypothetical protein SDC9_88046 [bioreactor metagenome]|uniref:Uncharacterized protein n=1 Tax=bioreactor metagenome TaxID=1076179 RepID=A0A644ZNJ0_9ZZZZ